LSQPYRGFEADVSSLLDCQHDNGAFAYAFVEQVIAENTILTAELQQEEMAQVLQNPPPFYQVSKVDQASMECSHQIHKSSLALLYNFFVCHISIPLRIETSFIVTSIPNSLLLDFLPLSLNCSPVRKFKMVPLTSNLHEMRGRTDIAHIPPMPL
jgi:hypothetical protein